MCIRDSTIPVWLLRGLREPESSRLLGDGVTRALGSRLLYTSDAADDLLCVDLGGRRILKKKTPPPPPILSSRSLTNPYQ